jgi:hypothetical protein
MRASLDIAGDKNFMIGKIEKYPDKQDIAYYKKSMPYI